MRPAEHQELQPLPTRPGCRRGPIRGQRHPVVRDMRPTDRRGYGRLHAGREKRALTRVWSGLAHESLLILHQFVETWRLSDTVGGAGNPSIPEPPTSA